MLLFFVCVQIIVLCLEHCSEVVADSEVLKIVLSMEAVNNMVDASFSASEAEVPLFVSYLKMIVLLLAPFVIGIPSALVIRVIAFERELHTKYYFFLVNLLITDFLGVLVNNVVQFVALVLYVSGSSIKLSCIFIEIFSIFSFAGQLLFITLGIDRFVAIASPYHHRKIMTKKVAVFIVGVVWDLAISITSVLLVQVPYVHLYPFARCYGLSGFPLIYLFKGSVMVSSTVLIIAINLYLYYKILQSNKKLKENMRLHGESSTTARRHVARRKNLHSQIKPTVSILLLGGMDGLINLLIPLLQIVFRLTLGNDSIARIYAIEFVIQPLKLVQLLCHPLVYGLYMTKIRRNIFNFELYYLIFGRRSKVIVLNQQWRQYM